MSAAEIERLRAMVLAHDDIYTKTAIAFDDFLLALHAAGVPEVTEPCCIRGFWHLGAAIELRRKADVLEIKHLMDLAYPAGIAGRPVPNPMNASEFLAALSAQTNPISHPVYRRKLVNLLIRAYRIPVAGAGEETVVTADSDAAVDAAFGNPLTEARAAIHARIPAAGVEAPPAVAAQAEGATCLESPALSELVAREIPEQSDKAFRTARKKFVMHIAEAIRMIRESCRPPIALAASHDRIIRFEPAVKPKTGNAGRAEFDAKSRAATNANIAVFDALRPPFSKTGGLRDAETELRGFDRELEKLQRAVKTAERQLADVRKTGVAAASSIAESTLASVRASYEASVAGRLPVAARVDLEKRMAALADFFKHDISDTKRREIVFGPHFSYFYLLNERLADVSLYVAGVETARAASAEGRAAAAESARAATAAAERAAALAVISERDRALAANIANPFKPGFYPKFINPGMVLPNGTTVTKQLFLAPKGSRRNGERILGPSGNPLERTDGWLVAGNHGIPAEGGARRRRATRRYRRRARKTRRSH